MITDFIKKFTDKNFEGVQKMGREFYLVNDSIEEIRKKVSYQADSAGVFLGEVKRKVFEPSLPLIDKLADVSDKKLVVDGHAEWLFLCGRDLMAKSVIKSNVKDGLVLVQNKNDENLGFGKVFGRTDEDNSRIVVKNILDKGDFLRREQC